MTIEEAIKRYADNAEYERTHGNLQGFLEFKHLAKWLRDYKRLLEREPILDKIRAEIQKLRGCSCSCSDGIIDDVEDILDKLIESEE